MKQLTEIIERLDMLQGDLPIGTPEQETVADLAELVAGLADEIKTVEGLERMILKGLVCTLKERWKARQSKPEEA